MAAAAGLTAAVLGARWGLIARFGVDVPFMDQWDGELERLYFKALDHTLTLGDFFLPANEHRILFTRLLNLAVFWVEGARMKNVAVMYCQAVVSVVPVFTFAYALNRSVIRPLSTALLGVVFVFPMGWENLFWAYQSQVYFAIAFASLGLLFIARPKLPVWPIALCTALGAVNTAAAMFTAATAAVAAIFRWWETRERLFLGKAALFALFSFAASRLIWHNPGHVIYQAKSAGQFLEVFWQYLSWPSDPWPAIGLLTWIALGACTVAVFLRKSDPERYEQRFGMFALIWVAMVAVAGSYARAAGIGSRYFDYLILLYAAAILVSAPLLDSVRWKWPVRAYQLALMIPMVVFGLHMEQVSRHIRTERRQMLDVTRSAVSAGRAGGVAAAQKTIEARPEVVLHPDPHAVATILMDPRAQYVLRDILP